MKIKCIECQSIHQVNGWISLDKPINEHQRCEVHLTCSCNNKMTVEHRHERASASNKRGNQITAVIGCEILPEMKKTGLVVPDYVHEFSDVLVHYFKEPEYENWNTPNSVENY